MSFTSILMLALGLAMDATAVAAARGLAAPTVRARDALLVAVYFGGSQALMPVLGWGLGQQLGPAVEAVDHWIAFVLLSLIGGKMMWEARGEPEPVDASENLFALWPMFVLAVATSIDAFAVGVTLPMLGAPFLRSIVTIGLVTAGLSVAGLFAGRHLGARLGKRLDFAGGLVLLGLGTRILVQHLTGA